MSLLDRILKKRKDAGLEKPVGDRLPPEVEAPQPEPEPAAVEEGPADAELDAEAAEEPDAAVLPASVDEREEERVEPAAEVVRAFEATQLRTDHPDLRPGDAIRVHATIREGDRERIQVFEGILIAMKHGGNRRTITVRKTSFGVAVERIFPLHSPLVARIEVVRSHHVRRAKLYFLRRRKGKAARLREKRR